MSHRPAASPWDAFDYRAAMARVEGWNSGWYLVMAIFIFLAFVFGPFYRRWAHDLTYPYRADRVHLHRLPSRR